MRSLVLQGSDSKWVAFKSSNGSFIDCVKYGITPHSYRRYDNGTGTWYIWWTKLPDLVDMAYKFFEHITYIDVPEEWKTNHSVDEEPKRVKRKNRSNSPFNSLFLTEDAPEEVIRAAYQALLSLYHPDHNAGKGDPEKLNRVIEAYKMIKKIRS